MAKKKAAKKVAKKATKKASKKVTKKLSKKMTKKPAKKAAKKARTAKKFNVVANTPVVANQASTPAAPVTLTSTPMPTGPM